MRAVQVPLRLRQGRRRSISTVIAAVLFGSVVGVTAGHASAASYMPSGFGISLSPPYQDSGHNTLVDVVVQVSDARVPAPYTLAIYGPSGYLALACYSAPVCSARGLHVGALAYAGIWHGYVLDNQTKPYSTFPSTFLVEATVDFASGNTGGGTLNWVTPPTPPDGSRYGPSDDGAFFQVAAKNPTHRVTITHTPLPQNVRCIEDTASQMGAATIRCFVRSVAAAGDVTFAAADDVGQRVSRTYHFQGYSSPLPLVLAHGIIRTPNVMDGAGAVAQSVVPGLTAGMVHSANTFPHKWPYSTDDPESREGSVYENGELIAADAQALIQSTGAPAVNVYAHSKGGLEARVAAFYHPDMINAVGMSATPNAGSPEADVLCQAWRASWAPWAGEGYAIAKSMFGDYGPCDGPNDGLYDLQTGYVQNDFNEKIRDSVHVDYSVTGSNCSDGDPIWHPLDEYSTAPTFYLCNAVSDDLCFGPSDMAVCEDSVYALSQLGSGANGGRELGLPPLSGYNHMEMEVAECPVSEVINHMYPTASATNPWTTGVCTGTYKLDPHFRAHAAAVSATVPQSSTAVVYPATRQGQSPFGGVASIGVPLSIPLEPEGGDAVELRLFTAGDVPTLTAVDMSGRALVTRVTPVPLSTGTVSPNLVVTVSGLKGKRGTVTVTSPGVTAVLGQTTVSSPLVMQTTATALRDGSAAIRATLLNAKVSQLSSAEVSAAFTAQDGSHQTVRLFRSGASNVFTAIAYPMRGSWQPIDVVASGSVNRIATTGVVIDDGSASLGLVTGSQLVDTDNDGLADALRIPVPVQSSQPGDFRVTVDLTSATSKPLSATGVGQVTGAGQVELVVPLADLVAAGASSSLDVTRAVLTTADGAERILSRSANIGTTGNVTPCTQNPSHLVLASTQVKSIDADGDGAYEGLLFELGACVPQIGAYTLTADVLAPGGEVVRHISQPVQVTAHSQAVEVLVPGSVISSFGSGKYALVNAILTKGDGSWTSERPMWSSSSDLDAWFWQTTRADPATLAAAWDAANSDGAISSHGLYVSDANRLVRVAGYMAAGSASAARRELNTFLDDLVPNAVTDPWRSRLLWYAGRVLATA